MRTNGLRRAGDGRLHGGLLYFSEGEACQFCAEAHARGFSIAIHAFGNEAIARAVQALPHSRPARATRVAPHRIEHFAMPARDDIQRAVDKDLAVSVQPSFIDRVGEEILGVGFPSPERFLPLREMLDRGLCVAGSSDAPAASIEPLRGMCSALTRRTSAGRALGVAQAIQPIDALLLYTRNAAVACGIEREQGTLEVGKRADLVWLTRDPLGPSALEGSIGVHATYIGGTAVYHANGSVETV